MPKAGGPRKYAPMRTGTVTETVARRLAAMEVGDSFEVRTAGDRSAVNRAATTLAAAGALRGRATTRKKDGGGYVVAMLPR